MKNKYSTTDHPLDAEVSIQGAQAIHAGKVITLTGNPADVNSIAQPTHIAPKEEPLTNAAASFTRTFPAYSVTLLRFPAKM